MRQPKTREDNRLKFGHLKISRTHKPDHDNYIEKHELSTTSLILCEEGSRFQFTEASRD